ncbi:MAG: hypothetical protein U0T82_16225 [Bacteroidales bacterium]
MDKIKFNSNINNADSVDPLLNQLLEVKNNVIEQIITMINETSDHEIRAKCILFLIDHFRDRKIPEALINLIKRPDLKNNNAFITYALGESCDCKDYLDFLIELVLEYGYNVSVHALNIIIDMEPPFNKDQIENLIKKIKTIKVKDEKKTFKKDLLLFLRRAKRFEY